MFACDKRIFAFWCNINNLSFEQPNILGTIRTRCWHPLALSIFSQQVLVSWNLLHGTDRNGTSLTNLQCWNNQPIIFNELIRPKIESFGMPFLGCTCWSVRGVSPSRFYKLNCAQILIKTFVFPFWTFTEFVDETNSWSLFRVFGDLNPISITFVCHCLWFVSYFRPNAFTTRQPRGTSVALRKAK